MLAVASIGSSCSSHRSAKPSSATRTTAAVAPTPKLAQTADEKLKAYNDAVNEWDALILAVPDHVLETEGIVISGQHFENYEEWAKANGKPVEAP